MAKCICVGNLAPECTLDELWALFQRFGRAHTSEMAIDGQTGQSTGFGYVEMNDDEEARRAIAALDGADLHGRRLEVREIKPRWEHGPKVEWRLVDMTEPVWDPYFDDQGWRYTVIDAEDTLVGALGRFSQDGPRSLTLEHSSGEQIYLNVNPVYSTVSWPVPGHPGSERSALPAQTTASSPERFVGEGVEFEVPPEGLLTTDEAIEVARHFYRTRQLADWVRWA